VSLIRIAEAKRTEEQRVALEYLPNEICRESPNGMISYTGSKTDADE
jgi:hypothetical protein